VVSFRLFLVEAPQWLKKWTALILEYIKVEVEKLPEIFLKAFPKFYDEKSAKNQAGGIECLRLQNLAITLDRVTHLLKQMNTKEPPIYPLTQEEIFNKLWGDEKSIRSQIEKLIDALEYEIYEGSKQYEIIQKLRAEINIILIRIGLNPEKGFKELNEMVRNRFSVLSSLFKSINSTTINTRALSEILLMYSNTTTYFTLCNAYERVVSKEVEVRLCDVTGEKSMISELIAEKQASTIYRGVKEYESSFIFAQLSGWFKQCANRTNASLVAEKRGTLSYPDIDSFIVKPIPKSYVGTMRQVMKMTAKIQKPPTIIEETETKRHDYPTGERDTFYKKIVEVPSFVWPTNNNWTYKNTMKLYGSITFDSVKKADEDNESDKWNYLRKVINMIRYGVSDIVSSND